MGWEGVRLVTESTEGEAGQELQAFPCNLLSEFPVSSGDILQ